MHVDPPGHHASRPSPGVCWLTGGWLRLAAASSRPPNAPSTAARRSSSIDLAHNKDPIRLGDKESDKKRNKKRKECKEIEDWQGGERVCAAGGCAQAQVYPRGCCVAHTQRSRGEERGHSSRGVGRRRASYRLQLGGRSRWRSVSWGWASWGRQWRPTSSATATASPSGTGPSPRYLLVGSAAALFCVCAAAVQSESVPSRPD